MRKAEPISDIQPKAVMSAEEITAWEALPASEQLARLRAAIDKGINSPNSTRTMDQILEDVLARHKDARP